MTTIPFDSFRPRSNAVNLGHLLTSMLRVEAA